MDGPQFLYDVNTGFGMAFVRWLSAGQATAAKINEELLSGQTKIFTPGINSRGYNKEELLKWFSILDIPETVKVRIAHSFGTHATALSMKYDPEGKFILFSPRINEMEFKKIMDSAGVRPEQVLTITCAGDWPHQPCDVKALLKGDLIGFIKSAFHGYETGPTTGFHLYIESDGKSFNENYKWCPGTNHGIQNLSINNENISGYYYTPSGNKTVFENVPINSILESFINSP